MGARNLCDLLRGFERLAGTEADIRRMLAELHGEGGVLNFQDTHRNPQNGQEYPVFLLPKRETLILISGYSVQMRARIIDRWRRSFRVREGRVSRVPKRAIGEMYARAEQAEAHPEFSEALKGKSEVTGRAPSVLCATAQPPILPMPLTHGQSSTRPASSQISKARSG